MDFKSSGIMPDLPSGKTPRKGQLIAWEKIQQQKSVNGQLPTGYGKTLVIDGCYSILKKLGTCNRMLIIFPSKSQKRQYKKEHPCAIDIGFSEIRADKKHQENSADVFCITVQALIQRGTFDMVMRMMQKCNWFLAIDEYHHYGEDKTWGIKSAYLPYIKRICLSATPYRKEDDSAFGEPDFQILYSEAFLEGAVKDLKAHQYEYILDIIDSNGNINQLNTSNFEEEFGDDGDKIDQLMLTRKMRYSSKYISPLVRIPLERLLGDRAVRPFLRNQALIFCMSVRHAQFVAEQIKRLHHELTVEWVGNGIDAKQDNSEEIIEKFKEGKIDVLCNYGMAGEGIDSINVTEIIFLKNARMNNSTIQQIGRGARVIYINGKVIEKIYCTVNFDTSCELAKGNYWEKDFKKVMDYNGEEFIDDEEGGERPESDGDYVPLPDEPQIIIVDIKLKKVYTSDDPEVQAIFKATIKADFGLDREGMVKDKNHHDWNKFFELVDEYNEKRATVKSEEEIIMQLSEALNGASSAVTGLVINKLYNNNRIEASLRGDIKKRINFQKAKEIGNVNNRDEESLRKHYKWIKDLETKILETGVPWWLR